MAAKYVKRVTLFKIAKEEDIEIALRQYETLLESALKDGKPYILSSEAGRVVNGSEPRAKGWTVCAQTTFSSLEDVKFYDEECDAHKKLKSIVLPLREDASVILFESDYPPSSTS